MPTLFSRFGQNILASRHRSSRPTSVIDSHHIKSPRIERVGHFVADLLRRLGHHHSSDPQADSRYSFWGLRAIALQGLHTYLWILQPL